MDYQLNAQDKFYSATCKNDPKDRIGLEIGDSKDASTFHPQVKLMRWDNEVNLSVRFLADSIPGVQSYSLSDGVVEYRKGQYKARFYERTDIEDGGYEFEIEIPKKPPTNTVAFSIETKGLDFFYQPELTAQEVAEGAQRPENVVGSYAVYYKDCPANYIDGKLYHAGKAFHLYRPHVKDSAGNETWASLSVDEVGKALTITVDQGWLNSAVYPVIIDPTFGYTTAGVSYSNNWGSVEGTVYNLSENGSVSSLTAWLNNGYKGGATTTYTRGAIYSVSGSTATKIATTEEITNIANATWATLNLASSESLTADNYLLVTNQKGDNAVRFHYDSGTATITYGDSTYTSPYTFPNTRTLETFWNRKYSIYATYTTASTDVTINATTLSLTSSSLAPTIVTQTQITTIPNTLALTSLLHQTTVIVPNRAPTVALNSPLDTGTTEDTTPTFIFTGTDPDGDPMRYQIQIDTVNTFNSQP
jgi:hypothetical protein